MLIGIDDYRSPEPALSGCVNDVELMRDVLVEHFRFRPEDIALVKNADATRLGILSALEALLQATQPDDNVVIHYAGHGSQMTDREGDEPSGLDSTWHTVDSSAWDAKAQQWVGENRDITDDEIAIWIQRFAQRTQFLTLVVDACHSGGISRDSGEERSRGTKPDDRPVAELPSSPIGPLPRASERSASGWGAPAQSYVLIAGCRSEERSMEVNPSSAAGRDKAHGALTWFLTRNLKEAEAGTTYKDVFEMATAQVTREKPGQHPQMEGRLDRAIFGIVDLPTATYRLVTARSERGEISLRGGAAHGMTVGSRYAIYPPGSKQFSGGAARPVGEVVISTVQAVSSKAQIVRGSEIAPDAIGEMCRAVEVQHAYGATRWEVSCEGAAPEVATLRALLAKSTDVGVSAEQTAAFRANAVDAQWIVTDANGKRIAPPVRLGSERVVASNIETVARWMRLRALENGDSASAMRTTPPMRLDLLKWKDDAWVPAPRETDGRTIIYDEGERIGFSVKKGFDRDLFLTLLDLDPTGAVVRVWPNTTVDALTGSQSFLIVPGSGDEPWTISFPENEPMEALYSSDETHEYVEETWLLIVTQQAADFRDYIQDGTIGGSPFEDEGPTRAIKMGPPKMDDDWTTVRQTMKIRRARK